MNRFIPLAAALVLLGIVAAPTVATAQAPRARPAGWSSNATG